MTELQTMKNIGKEMTRKLTNVGITSAEMLTHLGSEACFLKLKTIYPEIGAVHLYALQAAIEDIPFNQLSEKTKQQLKAFSQQFN